MILGDRKQDTKKHNITLLCVDDEDIIRDMLGHFLKRRFENVILAKDGRDGILKFQENSIDVVITDVVMPKLNGLKMAKEIKSISPKTPIIVATAFDDTDILIEAINIGVDGYVIKPINEKKLLEAIERAIVGYELESIKGEVLNKENLLNVVTEKSPIGIALISSKVVYANRSFEDIVGFSKDDIKDELFLDRFFLKLENEDKPKDDKREIFLESLYQKHKKPFELEIETKDGNIKYIELAVDKLEYSGENLYVFNLIDITKKKIYELEIEKNKILLLELNMELRSKNIELKEQLYIDKLTKLPNRSKLLNDLKSSKKPLLVLINIDSFKEINDFYGTDFGDFVIQDVARKIESLIDKSSLTLYKMQADEYAIFTPTYLGDEVSIEALTRLVHDEMERYVIVHKHQEIHIRLTLGVAFDSFSELLPKADIALKRAKKERLSHLVFNDSMILKENYEENFKWVNMLKSALEERRVVSYFQPILNNKTKKIEKYESLVRLIGKDGKIYSPFLFLDIAKKSRLYQKITQCVILNSFEKFHKLPYEFSINLSIDDILNEDNVEFIIKALKNYNISDRVIFEILESEGIDNYENVAKFINLVKSFGSKVAIDDFGSGYSNFAHILKLNIDFLKIDASIIKNSDIDKNSKIISKTIVNFSKEMNIKTVAEFVHSKSVLDNVIDFGVDYSQGFYIGEPNETIFQEPLNDI